MRADNIAPAGLDLAHDLIVLRRLPVFGYTEGEAIEQQAKMRQLSALEKRFVSRAFTASTAWGDRPAARRLRLDGGKRSRR